jgi:hypothetical protein
MRPLLWEGRGETSSSLVFVIIWLPMIGHRLLCAFFPYSVCSCTHAGLGFLGGGAALAFYVLAVVLWRVRAHGGVAALRRPLSLLPILATHKIPNTGRTRTQGRLTFWWEA